MNVGGNAIVNKRQFFKKSQRKRKETKESFNQGGFFFKKKNERLTRIERNGKRKLEIHFYFCER